MELRHLKYFVAVADHGGFAKAATALHVAQPALSRQIMDLERELGVILFERRPDGVRLTTLGVQFLRDARQVLSHANRAVMRVKARETNRAPALAVGYAELLAHWNEISTVLHRFRLAHAGVPLLAEQMYRTEMQTSLREGRIDLGLIGMAHWPPRGFDGVRLIPAFMTGVLLPEGSALAGKESISLTELTSLTWHHLPADATWDVYRHLRAQLQRYGFNARHRTTRPAGFTFIPQIAAGDGWALADDRMREALATLRLGVVYRPFSEPPIELWVTAVWRKGELTSPIRAFVETARELCESAEPAVFTKVETSEALRKKRAARPRSSNAGVKVER